MTPPAGIQRRVLVALMAVNGVMFVVELVAGWAGESTGLLADALDMLADAGVYGAALLAVGASPLAKARAARASGWVQLGLAGLLVAEVARRSLAGSEPESGVMMGISVLALAANAACLLLLRRHRHGEVHLRASWIFTATDVQVNLGVIAAGALVAITRSPWPDLVIGALVCGVVIRGGLRILGEARRATAAARGGSRRAAGRGARASYRPSRRA